MKRKICDNSALHSLEKYLRELLRHSGLFGSKNPTRQTIAIRSRKPATRSSLQTTSVSPPDGIRYESDFASAHHCLSLELAAARVTARCSEVA